MSKTKPQTFNDGNLRIYSVENTAGPGNKPNETLTLKRTLRYHRRIVGSQRFYSARQEQIKISHVLRCPEVKNISTQDIAVPNDGRQYHIRQIQYPEDIRPRVIDLTLEEVRTPYEFNRV